MPAQLPLLFEDKISTALLLKEILSLKVVDMRREIDAVDADIRRFSDPEYWEEHLDVVRPAILPIKESGVLPSIEDLLERADDESEFMAEHQEYLLERKRELEDQIKQIREMTYLIERHQFVRIAQLLQKEVEEIRLQITTFRDELKLTNMHFVIAKLSAQADFFELICTALNRTPASKA